MALYNYNKVILVGNLTRDPEINYTPAGQAVGKFTVAVNRRYKSSSGEQKQETNFIPVEVWQQQAENCKEYLKKGSSILVEGSIRTDAWTGQDGTTRRRLKVVAQRVQFLPSPGKEDFQAVPSQGGVQGEPRKSVGPPTNVGDREVKESAKEYLAGESAEAEETEKGTEDIGEGEEKIPF